MLGEVFGDSGATANKNEMGILELVPSLFCT